MVPDDNVLHESIQAGSVPSWLIFPAACECRCHFAQYGFQRNAGFGCCGFERFVTSPAEIETVLFKNANRCGRSHSDLPNRFGT